MATTTLHQSVAAMGATISSLAPMHMDLAFRRMMRGPGVVEERGFVRLMTGEAHPFGNMAFVREMGDVAVTERAIAPLLTCGMPSAVLFPGEAAAAVDARLVKAGYERHGGLPPMAVDIDALRATTLPDGYSLLRVGGKERKEWAEAFAAGYELPQGVADAFAPNEDVTTAEDAQIQYFAVRKGGRMVATSLVYLAEGVAGIYGVATVPSDRKKGLGAHLTAEPLRLVRALGYRVGVLQASEAGHPVYLKLGFTDVGELALYVRVS